MRSRKHEGTEPPSPEGASRSHPDAADALSNWYQVAKCSHWPTCGDVRRTFNSASYGDPHVIFNLKGNDYRLVTYIDYERGFVVMKLKALPA